MTKTKRMCLINLFIVLWSPVILCAQSTEYKVKAAFLERFTRFIEWPESSAIADTSKPFILGIIGKNPFGLTLEEFYSYQKIRSKKVEIQYFSNPDGIEKCHLLFISHSNKTQLSRILSRIRNKPILSVSDTKNFAEEGVLINFYIVENKIRFEINESEARKSGLSISYLLLKMAKITNPSE